MPIEHSIPGVYSTTPLDTWSYCSGFSVDLANSTIQFRYLRYADKASAYGDKPPIQRHQLTISGDEFNRAMAANQDIFSRIKAQLDAIALTRPEFAGGTEVD